MIFKVTIDAKGVKGIGAARAAYNASLIEGDETQPSPIATDAEYVQFVMERAAASYVAQYEV